MSGAPDSRDAVLRDFLTWLEQNDPGGAWYLDEGPVEPYPAAAASATPAPDAPVAPAAPGDAAPALGKVRRALPPIPDMDPEFRRKCDLFTAQTLDLIAHSPDAARGLAPDPYLAEAGGDRAAALERLRGEVLPCTKCELSGSRTNTVFGEGNPQADVVFIGEAPGADEDAQGRPFVGKSGQLLTKIIGAIGFGRDDVFICNILKCRPPQNRDPLPVEVAACEPHLKRQLAILQPRLICCLGRIAAQTLLGTDASLGRLRQTVHFYAGIPVLATYHPAALLRNPEYKRDTWDDVRKMRALHDALVERG
jgi:uracil-DNA glycosylase family 4